MKNFLKLRCLALGAMLGPVTCLAQTLPALEAMNTAVVTVTKVPTPWYGLPFLLRRGFRKAVPEYQAISGLRFKYFASTVRGRFFGGIYLWDHLNQAQQQFSPTWFDRVRRTYKAEGQVGYYPLLSAKQFVAPGYDFRRAEQHSVVLFLHATDAATAERAAQGAPGLLRLYAVEEQNARQGLILLFAAQRAAAAFLASSPIGAPELFTTPVLLHNQS